MVFQDDSFLGLASTQQAMTDRDRQSILRGLTEQVRQRVIETFPSHRLMHPDEEVERAVQSMAAEIVREYASRALARGGEPLPLPQEEVVHRIVGEILGMGMIEDLLGMAGVEDIVINGPKEVYIYRGGRWERVDVEFGSEDEVLRMLNRAIAPTGKQISPLEPVVDAVIPGGHRINIVSAPCSEPSPCAAIRVRRLFGITLRDVLGRDMYEAMITMEPPSVPDYREMESPGALFTGQAFAFLHYAVLAGMNIIVVGGTGVGKTSVLGVLGSLIPGWLRIVVIEDTRELNMRPVDDKLPHNCVYFTTRLGGLEGTPPVTQSDLVRAALRQRPDALTLGEARGGEVLDLLRALCTGHRNGLTSVHAESADDLVNRLKMMFQEADIRTEITDETIAEWIAQAFHIGIALEMTTVRMEGGRVGRARRVKEIVEFSGHVEGGRPARQALFRYDDGKRRLVRRPVFLTEPRERMLNAIGLSYGDIVAMDGSDGAAGGGPWLSM